ncbi:MAG: protein phosphatase 2C domain-containing protein [Candidatus Nomurabacteria bacterium]|nr:protein phosphatase 2C domain-containing protein [Candidatus Nomurabacteria bacterium]
MEKKGNTDSHFVIGKKHITQNSPCQDHALCGELNDALFMVVSDGCSSGRHTDIGARIITCATITAIKECLAQTSDITILPNLIHQTLILHAQNTVLQMGLTNQDLLATCVYSIVTPTGGFIHILGDGHAILKFKNGDIRLINTEWQNNTPYYPADNRKEQFIANHINTENGEKSLSVETINVINGAVAENEIFFNIQQSVTGYIISLTVEEIENLEVICITSDGIGRFKKDGNFLKPLEIAVRLTAFKNWTGEFVKRRLSRALLDYSKHETYPDDDVALAAIHFTINTEI